MQKNKGIPQQVDLSIIILNSNNKDLLKRCLLSIFKKTKGITYEIIVVDNNSQDRSAEMVKKEFKDKVMVIEGKENLGYSKGNNLGIKESKGRYIILLNEDTEVMNNAFKIMVDFIDSNEKAGVVGCTLYNSDLTKQEAYNDFYPKFFEAIKKSFMKEESEIEGIKKVGYVKGAAILLRRTTLEQVGLLDEQFFIFSEEIDLCYRINKVGWDIYFVSQGKIMHHSGVSSRHNKDKTVAYKFRRMALHNMFRFYLKHYGTLEMNILKIKTFVKLMRDIITLISKEKKREQLGEKLELLKTIFEEVVNTPRIPTLKK